MIIYQHRRELVKTTEDFVSLRTFIIKKTLVITLMLLSTERTQPKHSETTR
jgi:hypothetical protein